MKILVLSELWYPQGGGAELASHLYTNRIASTGNDVTVVTNEKAAIGLNKNVTFKQLIKSKNPTKLDLIRQSSKLTGKLKTLVKSYDTVYITGKLLYLAPKLKEEAPNLRIVVHLHDYQLVCPHASLFNAINDCTCEFIWSDLTCARCTRLYQRNNGKDSLSSLVGSLSSLAWKYVADISKIIDSVDQFITVSKAQSALIAKNLAQLSNSFIRKNLTIYNPIEIYGSYIEPVFESPCLGFLGGNNGYMKGLDRAIEIRKKLEEGQQFAKLLITRTPNIWKNGNVELLGVLSDQQLYEIYRKIWIVLFLSRASEPLPYVVIESQMRGRPVVATDTGGVVELIAKPGFTGEAIEFSFEKAISSVQKYLIHLKEDSLKYTQEISDISKEYYRRLASNSYDSLLTVLAK